MAGMFKRTRIAFIVALVAGVLWDVPAAHAAQVTCGQRITTSIKLDADLGPCLGNGLVVVANDLVIDLNGHTIRGGGKDPQAAIDQVGIRLSYVLRTTVKGGTVRDFFAGVLVLGGSQNDVDHMVVRHNIGLGNTAYGDGIVVDGSTANLITHNRAYGNGPFSGINMIHNASENVVSYNDVDDNNIPTPGAGPGGTDLQQDSGISNDTGAFANVIDHNTALRNGFIGISLAGGPGTQGLRATNNVIRDNGNLGINAGTQGDGHFVAGNTIVHNGYEQFGPSAAQGLDGGIVACGACFGPGTITTMQDNLVAKNKGFGIGNLFNGNEFTGGTGIYGTFPPQPYRPPRSNLVQRNVVRDNTSDGIYVECETVYDANFNASCLNPAPEHEGLRILDNDTSGNGGESAGITAWDLHDGNPHCDDNVWNGNTYVTAKPACTTAGGTLQP